MEHVDTLFERNKFEHVARALLSKYGILPPGWEKERDEEREKEKQQKC